MTTWRDFQQWTKDNPKVYPMFEKYAMQAARAGKIIGAKAIVERLRWDLTFDTDGDEMYKLNNNWTAFLARKFKEAHPDFARIFATRKSQADKEPTPMTYPTRGGQGFMNW